MWLPIFMFSIYILDTSGLNVHHMENEEKCQVQITHSLGHFALDEEPAIIKCPVFQYIQLDFTGFQLIWGKKGAEAITVEGSSRTETNQEALWFLPAVKEDSGIYSCIIRNSSFCVEISMSMTVVSNTPLSSPDLDYKLMAFENSNFHMYCPDILDFTNDPKNVKLRWYKNDKALVNENSRFQYFNGARYAIIKNVSHDDAGNYKCQLDFTYKNKDFTVSRIIHFRTIDHQRTQHPVIVKPSQKTIAAAIGSKLIIPCKVFTSPGESRLMVWWLANNSYIADYSEDGRVAQGTLQETAETDGQYTEVSLIFEWVEEEDFSTEFKCIAQNDHGYEILPTSIRPEASSFAWYIAAVPSLVVFLVIVIIIIYKHKKSGKTKDYSLSKF